MQIKKINRGLLPIYSKTIRQYISYAEEWGYNNKYTMNYVAESICDDLDIDYGIEYGIRGDDYFHVVKSLVNDILDGSKFYDIRLEDNDAN